MGKVYLEHPGGTRLYSCAKCSTVLTNRCNLLSTRFTGSTGRAFLFKKAVNLIESERQERVMLTGRHIVRDVSCKKCKSRLGWMYEYAMEEQQKYKEGKEQLGWKYEYAAEASQQYKEGKVILEMSKISGVFGNYGILEDV